MTFAITPLGEEQARLRSATGLACWHYHSTPVADEVESVPVWCFRFTAIDEAAMQDYLIRLWVKGYRLTRSKAIEWLVEDRICIPQHKIELREKTR